MTNGKRRRIASPFSFCWEREGSFFYASKNHRRGNGNTQNLRIAECHARFIALLTAQRIFCYQNKTGKNSRHNFAKLSAWWGVLCTQEEDSNLP